MYCHLEFGSKKKSTSHKEVYFSSRVNIVFAVWLMDSTQKRGIFLNVDIVYKI